MLEVTPAASPDGTYTIVSATGGTPPYAWTAIPVGGAPYPLALTAQDPTGATTVDPYAPLGRAVVYQVTDATALGKDSDPFTLPDPGHAILSDAMNPAVNAAVTVRDATPHTWEGRSVWFDVLDRRDPFPAVAPLRLRGGIVVLRVTTQDERSAIMSVLAPGHVTILRSPCAAAVDDLVFITESLEEALVLEDGKALPHPRDWTIRYQAVTRDLGPYLPDPTWTWEDLSTDPRTPSWDVTVAAFGSWTDLEANVRKP